MLFIALSVLVATILVVCSTIIACLIIRSPKNQAVIWYSWITLTSFLVIIGSIVAIHFQQSGEGLQHSPLAIFAVAFLTEVFIASLLGVIQEWVFDTSGNFRKIDYAILAGIWLVTVIIVVFAGGLATVTIAAGQCSSNVSECFS